MRTYEALYIVRPQLTDDEIQTVVDGALKLITNNGGTIVRSEVWGKRRLAYEVKKQQEGVFVLVRFQAPGDTIKKLREHFRLSESIIRHLVVFFDARTLRLEEEQIERNKVLQETRGSAFGRDRDDDDEDEDEPRPRRDRARAAPHAGPRPPYRGPRPEGDRPPRTETAKV